MRAIVLAGGQGTRLKPYTTLLPKALVPLGDMPVLELVLRQLRHHGFTEITLAVGHLAELIQAYFGTGEKLGVTLTYVREASPLGTAGPLQLVDREHPLPEHFLVMNADIVSDIHYQSLFEAHVKAYEQTGVTATIATYQRTSKIDFGILEFDAESKRISDFIEKPTLTHAVSMGVYLFHRDVLQHIPEHTFFGFDHLMHTLLVANTPIQAFPFSGYWLDIGRVDDYETAVSDFQAMREKLLPKNTLHNRPSDSSPLQPAVPV